MKTSDDFRETRLDGSVEFDGELLKLEVDRVRLPDGREARREVIRHPGAAVVLPILEDGRIVLVRQFRYALDQILLELPAGKLDPGENPAECAARELAEETGMTPGELIPLGRFYVAPGFSDELIHAFLARGLQSGAMAEPDADENIEMLIMTREELDEAIRAGRIVDAKTISAIHLADCTLRSSARRRGSADHDGR